MLFFWQAHLQMRPANLPREGPVQPSPPASITESRPKGTLVYMQQNAGGCDETSSFFRPKRAGGVTGGFRLRSHSRATIPRTTCAQRWVTSLRLDPPRPHLFLVSHKHLSVLPAKHAGCHLPPAAASLAWTLLPPSAPGAWSAVLPTGGRSLPAMASATTSLPPRHSHGSSLRTSETYPPPRAPRSPPHLGSPLSTPRSCCSFHDGNASPAALAPQLFWQNCDTPLIYI